MSRAKGARSQLAAAFEAAFGAPVTSNTKATGSILLILFAANPEDGNIITLGGTR